jgi:hypothetical protein
MIDSLDTRENRREGSRDFGPKTKKNAVPSTLLMLGVALLFLGACEHVVGWGIPSKRHPLGQKVDPDEIYMWLVASACLIVAAGIIRLFDLLKKRP